MRKICAVVSSRANYSSIKSVLRSVSQNKNLILQIVVGASALIDRFGSAVDLIKKDGFKINNRVHILIEGETVETMAKSTGMGLLEFPTVFRHLKPDIVLIVGDRFENMAASIAASYMNIPIAHTMGGEVSGTIDESIRHAITKFSHIHFPASKSAKERIIKLGERKENVFLVIGMMIGKDPYSFIKKLIKNLSAIFLLPIPDHQYIRPYEIKNNIKRDISSKITIECSLDIKEVLKIIKENYPSGKLVICGSLYLAGDILKKDGF